MKLFSQEERWVSAARKGDPDAFEALVRAYEKRTYAWALALCGDPQDAAEAVQEAFFSAWRGLPDFRGEASFSSWLYRLTRNASLDLLRREKRHRAAAGPSLDDEDLFMELPDRSAGPQELLERQELREAVRRGLETLTPEYREVLVLREMHQLSYDEIARTLELDLGTIKSRISRGRRQLSRFLCSDGNFSGKNPSEPVKKEGRS